MAKGVLPPDHPLNMYTVWLQVRDYVLCGIHEADLIITVGYDFVEYLPIYWNEENPKPIIHIDTLPAEVDQHYPVAVELVGDITETLDYLIKNVKESKQCMPNGELHQKLKNELHRINGGVTSDIGENTAKIKPQTILQELEKAVTEDTIVISDVSAHKI
jgi:acetolactate synthase-1/2/3 large subunit